MKNYVEIVHHWEEDIGRNLGFVHHDVYYAVRPTPDSYTRHGAEESRFGDSGYAIYGGLPVYVTGLEDVAALRKLLDAIEEELNAEV